MWIYSSWSVLGRNGFLVHPHQIVKPSPEGMDVSMKTCTIVLEFLTVLCTDTAISTEGDPRMSGRLEGTSGKHVVQLVSADFKGASKFVSYLKFCLSFSWRAAEGSGDTKGVGAECNHYEISVRDTSGSNITLTVVTETRSGRQLLFDNCVFSIERILICDGGAPIDVMKVALDHIEGAVYQDDSGVSNAKKREISWHCVSAATCQL